MSYNYTEVGILAGKMVAKVLNGEKISALPVSTLGKFHAFVNLKAVEQFGLNIPEAILKTAEIIK